MELYVLQYGREAGVLILYRFMISKQAWKEEVHQFEILVNNFVVNLY